MCCYFKRIFGSGALKGLSCNQGNLRYCLIMVIWSLNKALYFWVQLIIIRRAVIMRTLLFSAAAALKTRKLAHAAPVSQIRATLMESDWWGPPRPLLSPQGLCECV